MVGTLVRGSGTKRLGLRADMDALPIDEASGAGWSRSFERYPCDAIFAMHNMPGIAQGRLVLRDGAAMASSDYASITLDGVGGHGAMPQHAADPVVATASIVMALQTIVSRNIDPLHAAVVTVGALHSGKANGGGNGEGGCMVHNPGYDFNDHNVAVGSAFWALLAERFLTQP